MLSFRLQVLAESKGLIGKKLEEYCSSISKRFPGKRLNHNTVRKWRVDFENKGISGLVPAWGKNKDRFTKYNNRAAKLFNKYYFVERRGSARLCADLTRESLGENSIELPHSNTLKRHAMRMTPRRYPKETYLLSIRKYADLEGVNIKTVQYRCKHGLIDSIKVLGRGGEQYRISVNFLSENGFIKYYGGKEIDDKDTATSSTMRPCNGSDKEQGCL